jgi:hypothetical protein
MLFNARFAFNNGMGQARPMASNMTKSGSVMSSRMQRRDVSVCVKLSRGAPFTPPWLDVGTIGGLTGTKGRHFNVFRKDIERAYGPGARYLCETHHILSFLLFKLHVIYTYGMFLLL